MISTARIAGGGLSGLATATLLARRGVRVEVFERRRGGSGRFSGGWQVLENGSEERDVLDEVRGLHLQDGLEAIPARQAVFLDGRGRTHPIWSRSPFAYFVRRGGGAGTLDTAMRLAALEAGVALREGESAPAHVDVVATGPGQADGVAREVVFGSDLPDTVAVLFDPAVTPTGYAYLFCLSGHATFGVAQVRRVAGLPDAQKAAWERFRAALGPFSVQADHEGGQVMNFSLPRHLQAANGKWYVGEAAGVQDFLYGLGNRLALRSAALAAGGILGRWDEEAFGRDILRPMRNSVALRLAYERLGRRSFAAFCASAASRDFRSFLTRLQRPTVAAAWLARLAMAAWRERRGCRHSPVCGWCRRRER